MQYIKENFKRQPSEAFTDEEISYLKWFLIELEKIKTVEGVLLMPKYTEIDRRHYIDDYCEMTFYVIADTSSDDMKIIWEKIDTVKGALPFKSYIPTNDIYFEIDDAKEFFDPDNKDLMWNFDDTILVSSYILFDRYDRLAMRQDKLRNKVTPVTTLSEMRNIDKLDVSVTKRKHL